MSSEFKIVVKWSGKEYPIESISESDDVGALKVAIQEATGVRPERQKLLNLKAKDDCIVLSTLKLKPGFKIMLMGSLEEDVLAAAPPPEEEMPEVVNDLDIEDEEVAIEKKEVYLSKIERRIQQYEIKILNELRDGKKLLVLDIDYTLFDHRSVAETGYELMRPYLHEFLEAAYNDYDIVIWSATSMKWIDEKMKLLGVTNNPKYKIAFHLDSLAMISVHTKKYGVIEVKPLGVIWGKFTQYSASNTIMFDDIRRNFIMNPQTGLKIRPFKNAHMNRAVDRELLQLAGYLKAIAQLEDFTDLNHKHWERFGTSHKSKKRRAREDTA
ncbi:ubiquitin-like domain-containing CTD phosphatase 1 [Neocloeon triangulifer]|uniref:ubiquitin-like domain-containing CTD phosphatase 1 n=1 Tax=Neocloeon triangulifer TaxID=2078957 RepID=UPI00286EF609|nr:ubiquitin-like domain-containing CTD phosphatase 1 [Neocloeon triangulifer]